MKNLLNKKEAGELIPPANYPFEWEEHCGACDWFGDEEGCPFYNIVKNSPDTYWKDIGCDSFWD